MVEKPRIVFPDGDEQVKELLDTSERVRALERLGDFELYVGTPDDDNEFVTRLQGANGVMLGWKIPVEVMSRCPDLRVISFTGAGPANFIDIAEANSQGITVTSTPGYGDAAVAEHALGLILASLRHTVRLDRSMRQGNWVQSVPGAELSGATVGIVGLGGIGQYMARLCGAMANEVLCWTRNPSPARAEEHGVRFVELSDLFHLSDVVTIHLALSPNTEGIINKAMLDRLKPGAVFVNTARAELIDTKALYDALREGRLVGGLDVFEAEPLPEEHPLLGVDNVTLTPHVGYNTPEAIGRIMDIAIDNLVAYFSGSPKNVVGKVAASRK